MRTVLGVLLSLLLCSQPIVAGDMQTDTAPSDIGLAQYEGQYEYENGTTLIIVSGPHNEILYASINGARYPLRPVGSDVFLNSGDVEVVFVRGDNEEIIGYRERRLSTLESNPLFRLLDRSRRLSPAIWHARPREAPEWYVYRPPEELEDDLPVSALSAGDPLLEPQNAMLVLTGGGYNQPSHTNKLLTEFVLPGLAPENRQLGVRQAQGPER
jgi:hypothetical protein